MRDQRAKPVLSDDAVQLCGVVDGEVRGDVHGMKPGIGGQRGCWNYRIQPAQ
jgi:hypothetical protein